MTRRYRPLSKDELAKFTRKTAFQLRLAQRACLKRKSLLDRLVTMLLSRALKPKSPEEDFMRDEMVDADIGFSAEELDSYQSGSRSGQSESR